MGSGKRLHNDFDDCGDFDDPRYFRRLKRRRFINGSISFNSLKRTRCIGGGVLSKNVRQVDVVRLDDDVDDDATVLFVNSKCATNTALEELTGDDAIDDGSAHDIGNVYGGKRDDSVTGYMDIEKPDAVLQKNGSLGNRSSNNNNFVADMAREIVGPDKSDDVDSDYQNYLNENRADDNIQNAGFVSEVARHKNRSMSTATTDSVTDADPDYKIFLDNMRPNGSSYEVKFSFNDGVFQVVLYEEDRVDPSCNTDVLERAQRHTKKSKSFNRALRGRKAQHRSNAMKEKTFRSTRNVLHKKAKRSQINKKKRKAAKATTLSSTGKHANKSTVVEDKMEGNADRSTDMAGKHQTSLHNNFGLCVKEEVEDEAYEICLNPLKEDVKHASSTPINIMQGTTEVGQCCEDEGEDEVIIVDNVPFANDNHTPFISSKSCVLDDDGQPFYKASTEDTNSRFKEGLLEMLEKPYDEGEYKDLWNRVSERKPIERERNLRGSYKIYTTPGLGQSYLDKCGDLKKILDEGPDDKPKQLKLLRGFFYWLQNTVVEGSFKPWLDRSCL